MSPLSSRGPGIQRSQRDVGATFIHKDEPVRIQWLHLLPKARSLFLAAFTGSQRFFFRVQPRRLMARLMVAVLTRTPCVCSHSRQCSSNPTSSWACSCATSPACKGANFLGGRPGIGLGATSPVSCRCLRYRLIVASETPNSFTISVRGEPWSTARSTFARKSSEYAFMSLLPFLCSLLPPFLILPSSSTLPQVAVDKLAVTELLFQNLCRLNHLFNQIMRWFS